MKSFQDSALTPCLIKHRENGLSRKCSEAKNLFRSQNLESLNWLQKCSYFFMFVTSIIQASFHRWCNNSRGDFYRYCNVNEFMLTTPMIWVHRSGSSRHTSRSITCTTAWCVARIDQVLWRCWITIGKLQHHYHNVKPQIAQMPVALSGVQLHLVRGFLILGSILHTVLLPSLRRAIVGKGCATATKKLQLRFFYDENSRRRMQF